MILKEKKSFISFNSFMFFFQAFFSSSSLIVTGVMKDQHCSASEPAAADVEKGQRPCLYESSEPARRQQDGLVMVCQLAAMCEACNCDLFKSS